MTNGMPRLEKSVYAALEEAYNALLKASNEADIIDAVEAAKISTVRKQVLALIETDLCF